MNTNVKRPSIKHHEGYTEIFHHDLELDTLILSLYRQNKVSHDSGTHRIKTPQFTIIFKATRFHDVINSGCELDVSDIMLSKWMGTWDSQTSVSFTRIDKTVFLTLLQLI